jgi:hypothetical protein
MRGAEMGKRFLLYGLVVMSGLSTQEALTKPLVFLTCTFTNGGVVRIRIDQDAKKADFLNGGTFALEVSEGSFTLTSKFDFGASGGGVVDLETKIDRRSQQLISTVAGKNKGYFTPYPLSGTCSGDQPWLGTIF